LGRSQRKTSHSLKGRLRCRSIETEPGRAFFVAKSTKKSTGVGLKRPTIYDFKRSQIKRKLVQGVKQLSQNLPMLGRKIFKEESEGTSRVVGGRRATKKRKVLCRRPTAFRTRPD